MNSRCNRLTIALGGLCVGLIVMCGYLFWHHSWLRIRVEWASEQTEVFEQMKTQALRSDAAGAAGCLEYVVFYYPSGSKLERGSPLDRMVERDRREASREIIDYLRMTTGNDLGERPEAWVQAYAESGL